MSDRFDQHFRQMRPAFALRLANELPASSISVNRPVISTSMLLSGGKGHAVLKQLTPEVIRHDLADSHIFSAKMRGFFYTASHMNHCESSIGSRQASKLAIDIASDVD